MSFAAAQYRAATVETASPVQIVVRLYDGAVQNFKQALNAIDAGDVKTRNEHLSRAHAIVTELQASLVHSHAHDLCMDLERLYDFVLHSIARANVNGERDGIESSMRVLKELRGAWAELARKNG